MRPFGALVFGRLGDLVGRKYTFLITIVIMGASTALVGCLPTYETIGVTAPIIFIVLRLLQGLALGGQYGGAATYISEHAPEGRRGLYTSWIQTTATLGFFLSLLVILACRFAMSPEQFDAWGWRVPFLLSTVLLLISVYIRLQLQESPVFQEIKAAGQLSKAPLSESFGQWANLKIVLLALLGATAGQAVVWYGGQFYALLFLEKTLQVDSTSAQLVMAAALLIATPFFVVFGALSDKIGRKKIVLAGCLIAALTYFPIFKGITHFANPALDAAVQTAPVTVVADPASAASSSIPSARSSTPAAATWRRARSRAWASRIRTRVRAPQAQRASEDRRRVGHDRGAAAGRAGRQAVRCRVQEGAGRRHREAQGSAARRRAIPPRPT